MRALIKAEEYISTNPDGAMEALAEATEGVMSMDVIKTKFEEAEYEVGLSNGLLNILKPKRNGLSAKVWLMLNLLESLEGFS